MSKDRSFEAYQQLAIAAYALYDARPYCAANVIGSAATNASDTARETNADQNEWLHYFWVSLNAVLDFDEVPNDVRDWFKQQLKG